MSTADQSTPKNTLSSFGLGFIKRREECRLKVYIDTRGRPTIGYGHLLGAPFPPGLTWTFEEALSQLALDTRVACGAINTLVKVQLSQPQFDALASLVFNIGIGAFQTSTLLKRLNEGDYKKAGEQILVWCKQPELKTRRELEKAIWDYGMTD